MGREEQIEEREVLDSIFPDEITGHSPSFLPSLPINLKRKRRKSADLPPPFWHQISQRHPTASRSHWISPVKMETLLLLKSVRPSPFYLPPHSDSYNSSPQQHPSPSSSQSPTRHPTPTPPQTSTSPSPPTPPECLSSPSRKTKRACCPPSTTPSPSVWAK